MPIPPRLARLSPPIMAPFYPAANKRVSLHNVNIIGRYELFPKIETNG